MQKMTKRKICKMQPSILSLDLKKGLEPSNNQPEKSLAQVKIIEEK